jgi:replicative DNA helicase
VDAAIILGAQANREVKSLETFQMENMREAGDIEQDANIVIGVWDKEAAELNDLNEKLSDIKIQIKNIDLGYLHKKGYKQEKLGDIQKNINKRIQKLEKSVSKRITFKILKNRNGKNNVAHEVISYPERFCLVDDIEWAEESNPDKSTNVEDHFE